MRGQAVCVMNSLKPTPCTPGTLSLVRRASTNFCQSCLITGLGPDMNPAALRSISA